MLSGKIHYIETTEALAYLPETSYNIWCEISAHTIPCIYCSSPRLAICLSAPYIGKVRVLHPALKDIIDWGQTTAPPPNLNINSTILVARLVRIHSGHVSMLRDPKASGHTTHPRRVLHRCEFRMQWTRRYGMRLCKRMWNSGIEQYTTLIACTIKQFAIVIYKLEIQLEIDVNATITLLLVFFHTPTAYIENAATTYK